MKQENLYYRNCLRRKNIIKEAIFGLVLDFASYPRLILEVFIRKNFGDRYFKMSSAWTVAVVLALFPNLSLLFSFSRYGASWFDLSYLTWYLFIALFLFVSYRRNREIKMEKSSFDFSKFTRYSGDINPLFWTISIFGRTTIRKIETRYEPLFFLLISLVLIFFNQKLGYLICISSILYGFSYSAAYHIGDNFIKDKIDEIIMNEELHDVFVLDRSPEECRGVRFYMDKPNTQDARKKLSEYFIETDTVAVVS